MDNVYSINLNTHFYIWNTHTLKTVYHVLAYAQFIVDTGTADAKFKVEDFDVILGGTDGTNEFLIMSGKKIENPEINYEHLFKVDSEGTVQTRDLVPQLDLTYDVGKPDLRYRNIYGNTIYADEFVGNFGGSFDPGFTEGSVIFMGEDGLSEDNDNFYWDDENKRLGIGTNSPVHKIQIIGSGLSPGTPLFSVKNPVSTELAYFRITNDADYGIGISATGTNYLVPNIAAFGSSGNFTSMTFLTNGNVMQGGTTPIYFSPGGYTVSPTMVVTPGNTGRVGINTMVPSRKLEILDASNSQLRLTHTSGTIFTDFRMNSNGHLEIVPTGNLLAVYNTSQNVAIQAGENHDYKVYMQWNRASNYGIIQTVRVQYGGNLVLQPNAGNVGIGTNTPSSRLEVAGGDIRVTGGSFIDDGTTLNVPDYVFDGDYQLLSFDSLERYIYDHRHLPNVPSREELKKDGMNYGEMMMNILEKTEENTLYSLKNYHDIRGTQSILEVLKRMDAENDLSHEERIKKLEEENSKSVTGELVTYSTEEPSITSDHLTSLQDQLNLLEEKLSKLEGSTVSIEDILSEEDQKFIENLTKLVTVNENGLTIDGNLKVVNIETERMQSKEGAFEKVKADTADFVDTKFKNPVKFSENIVGWAEIERGEKNIFIESHLIGEKTFIFITPISSTHGESLFVKEKKNKIGFTVSIDHEVEDDIQFAWWIVEKND